MSTSDVRFSMSLPEVLNKDIEDLCVRRGYKKLEFIREAVRDKIKRERQEMATA